MRQAILAAIGTLIAAIGLTGGSIALGEPEPTSPEISGPAPLLTRPPVLPPVSIPTPAPPLVLAIDNTRAEPERFTPPPPQEPDPKPNSEPDTQVAEVLVTPSPSADTGMGSGVEQWRSLVTSYFGDVGGTEVALCLMGHESGGNPNATNPSSGASGLMQVLPSWADTFGVTRDALYDPATNLSISRALYDDGGWGHWSPWNRGECH